MITEKTLNERTCKFVNRGAIESFETGMNLIVKDYLTVPAQQSHFVSMTKTYMCVD